MTLAVRRNLLIGPLCVALLAVGCSSKTPDRNGGETGTTGTASAPTQFGKPAAPALGTALKSDVTEIRKLGVRLRSSRPDRKAVEPELLSALKTTNPEVRVEAVRALGRGFGDGSDNTPSRQTVRALAELLREEDEALRREAAD